MQSLIVKPWSPGLLDDPDLFPDYVIHRMAAAGIGRVEADRAPTGQDFVWRYVSRAAGEEEWMRHSPATCRNLLARWARFANADPYCSQVLFAVDAQPEWPAAATHRFSLFLCNEPTMGVWFKLYLYCIDGVWPMPHH
jgi:hypothetical protein